MRAKIPVGRYLNTDHITNQRRGALTPDELAFQYDPSEHEYHSKNDIVEIMYTKKQADAGAYGDQKLNDFLSKIAEQMLNDVKKVYVSDEDNVSHEIYITKKV